MIFHWQIFKRQTHPTLSCGYLIPATDSEVILGDQIQASILPTHISSIHQSLYQTLDRGQNSTNFFTSVFLAGVFLFSGVRSRHYMLHHVTDMRFHGPACRNITPSLRPLCNAE